MALLYSYEAVVSMFFFQSFWSLENRTLKCEQPYFDNPY